MKIEIFTLGELYENCYLISDNGNAIIIDPGYDGLKIDAYLKNSNYQLRAILLTHGHYDHIGAVDYLYSIYKCPIYAHYNDYDLFSGIKNKIPLNLSRFYDINRVKAPIQYIYEDFKALEIADIKIDAILTSGHSNGSLTFVLRDYKRIFSGDTVFKGSIGRTDFPTSNVNKMKESINIYKTFTDDCIINPGHGEPTSIKDEKENNQFFR